MKAIERGLLSRAVVFVVCLVMAMMVDTVVGEGAESGGYPSCSIKTKYKTKYKTKTTTKWKVSTATKTITSTLLPTCPSTYPPTPTPTLPACAPTSTAPIANYDDLIFTEPDANPIGTYEALTYSNFFVDRFDGFIPPISGSQYAMSYSYSAAPRRISIAIPPGTPPELEDNFYFSLKFMYFACNCCYPQGECKISIKGTKVSGKVVRLEVGYDALDSQQGFEMMGVTFDEDEEGPHPPGFEAPWTKLKSIEFERVEIGGSQEYTGLMIDGLHYLASGCA